MSVFPEVDLKAKASVEEDKINALWAENDAFKRQISEKDDAADNAYVFYDGPPFATGLPHYGHFVASTIKDVVPRYWAMRGKKVERRFGWDTHGLPIEMEIEKILKLTGPTSIREYGIDKFNESCRDGVLKYTEEWRKTLTRLGRWVDFDNDYKTMDLSFMESVWWVFAELWKKDMVYQGVRVMPFSWRLSTPVSNFEANMDYRDVDDPAVTVRLAVDGMEKTDLLIWTTTPWTLPSNLAVAVGEDLDYVYAKRDPELKGALAYLESDHIYIVAKERCETVLGKNAEIIKEVKGSTLVGLKYAPLFEYFAAQKSENAFQVIASSHVGTDAGTGLVHMAPAYGEDDFNGCQKVGIEPVDPVDEEGNFTSEVSDFAGRNIKEADADIIAMLKDKEQLFKHDRVRHSYPFCWRSGTPLIYKTVPVWFVRVEQMRERMMKHNDSIHWVPENVGKKRFGNWLKDARDWAISRNRFWGTPLPIWKCGSCEDFTCLGSAQELADKTGAEVTDLHSHKIDHLTFDCEKCDGGEKKRILEVFDCWFESGSMPYAQNHYPFENKEAFEGNFPAEFIAEGLDQTRGWFYTLLVLSTALFDRPPFKTCVVNGMVLAEDGEKMSKSKKNYPDPNIVLDSYGADALRAYLVNSPVVRAEPLRFSEKGVHEVTRNVIIPLKNAWSFFVQYANIDGYDPSVDLQKASPMSERPALDRWILSTMQSLIKEVNSQMEGSYLYNVVPPMLNFIDDLTNWYIRLNRRRFWASRNANNAAQDKYNAYATLYEVLTAFSKLTAPVLPFLSEMLYQNLVVSPGLNSAKDSVHLEDYPREDKSKIDTDLEEAMSAIRTVVTMGRTLRERHKLKTRQPLPKITVVSHNPNVLAAMGAFENLICQELNLKSVSVSDDESGLCKVLLKANYKTLGRRLGKKMKVVATQIMKLEGAEFQALRAGENVEVEGESISLEDVMITYEALNEGQVIESIGDVTVALDTALTDELKQEGFVRELLSKLQQMRKDTGLEIADRIKVELGLSDEWEKSAVTLHLNYMQEELLADQISLVSFSDGEDTILVNDIKVYIKMNKA